MSILVFILRLALGKYVHFIRKPLDTSQERVENLAQIGAGMWIFVKWTYLRSWKGQIPQRCKMNGLGAVSGNYTRIIYPKGYNTGNADTRGLSILSGALS